MENEEWRDVVGYEGLYQVSSIGRVRSLRENTRIVDKENGIMRQKYDRRGYLRVNLHKDGKCKALLVSRLVAMAFIDNPDNYPVVGHMDDNKTNNTVENLYWTTQKENHYHNGKFERFLASHNEKIFQIASALSTPVISTDIFTGEEKWFKSMQEASKTVGAESNKISMCCNGKRKSHRGMAWRFA